MTRRCPLRRSAPCWLPLPVLLAAPLVQAAAFLPGAEPDPPTGVVQREAPVAAEPPARDGVRWELAPWRYSGSLALELRSLRSEDGLRTTNGLVLGDVDFASWIWQPWFVQVRFGVGWIASRSSSEGDSGSGQGLSLTGRTAIAVFPASRFPFELRADVTDSRTDSLTLGGEYRSRRIALSQGWRPEQGSDSVQLNLDRSTIDSDGSTDTLTVFTATATALRGPHQIELGANRSEHDTSDRDERTTLTALNAHHSWRPAPALQVETLASWNEVKLAGPLGELGSDVRQLSSFGSWRVEEGALKGALLAGSARWVESRNLGTADDAKLQGLNATLGGSLELTPSWRVALSGSANELRSDAGGESRSVVTQGVLAWSPAGIGLAGWRWTPSAAMNGAFAHDSSRGERKVAGAQFSHALTRDFETGEHSVLGIGLTQGLAATRESGTPEWARAFSHGASVSWQHMTPEGRQDYASLSYSESRSLGGTSEGRFQLANLQLSQRTQLTRSSSWSVNFTAQATRNQFTEFDPFSGTWNERGDDWLPFYAGSLGYEQSRAFGVPRLRFSLLAAAQSQQIERRSAGDIDAVRERVSRSIEARLDWNIGRLETRLAARAAQVDGRSVVALQARAQRRF